MPTRIVTLLSDLGTTDAYAGIVKGILLTRAADVQIVDLTHAAEPGSPYPAAYFLAAALRYFPPGTVHLVLTDPGASPVHKVLAAEVQGQYLVTPDSGVASLTFEEFSAAKVVEVENQEYFLPPVGETFHSRAIYAPVAAAIAMGTPLEQLGPPVVRWTTLEHATAHEDREGHVTGEVVHIDRFGNLVTNIRSRQIPSPARVTVGGRTIDRISRSFSDVGPGQLLAIIGSAGNLEICVNQRSAAEQLYVTVSDRVIVEPA